jgi:hypothetical protein
VVERSPEKAGVGGSTPSLATIISHVTGLPFYGNQMLGDAFYTVTIFGGYAILSRLRQPLRQAA